MAMHGVSQGPAWYVHEQMEKVVLIACVYGKYEIMLITRLL